jgi:hypothetical protein
VSAPHRALRPSVSSAPLGLSALRAPDPAKPYWREPDGTRHSYRSLRCRLEPGLAAELRDAHLNAIERIAAARLCGEIRGLWPASAVEIRRK